MQGYPPPIYSNFSEKIRSQNGGIFDTLLQLFCKIQEILAKAMTSAYHIFRILAKS